MSAQYIVLEYEASELAITNDFDQADHLQLFNVMREMWRSRGGFAAAWRTASVLCTPQFP